MAETWHERAGWRAKEYFDDPLVIQLCQAIEAHQLKEVERLISAGADVRALGKGNMTPLMWAFLDCPDEFLLLLKHGADPNVIFQSEFGLNLILEGAAVTHLAAQAPRTAYFDAVFEHGGAVDLEANTKVYSKSTPIFCLVQGSARDKEKRLAKLIELGANINHLNGNEQTPAEFAALRGQLNLTLQLLEAGADNSIYQRDSNHQLVHTILLLERRKKDYSAAQRESWDKVIEWLAEHGVDVDAAREDLKRWQVPMTPEKYAKMMRAEVAARKAREAKLAAEAAAKD